MTEDEQQRLVEESDFKPNAIAFALGRFDGNVADALAWLAEIADESEAKVSGDG